VITQRWSRGVAISLASLFLVTIVGFLDLVTGPEISFSIFYVAPIFAVSWLVGWDAGLGLALLSGILSCLVDQSGGKMYDSIMIPYWNATVRTVFFVFVGVGVPFLKKELKKSSDALNKLSRLLPICAWCKRIRNDSGSWHRLEEYLESSSGLEVTHGICPCCIKKYYPDRSIEDEKGKDELNEQNPHRYAEVVSQD